MPYPYADRDWTNVPDGTTPPVGAPVVDADMLEAVEDSLREHDAHAAANYSVHGGQVWYVAAAASPPGSPPTGLHWYKTDTEEEVINTGTSGSPVWTARSEDAFKLTSADLVSDYVVSGLLAPVPSNSLTLAIPSGIAIVTGKRISKSSASQAVPAGKSTFVDIINTGAYSNVDNGVLLEDCEDTWNEHTDADFTQSIIAGQVGNALRLAIAAGASAGDFVSESIPSTDISAYGKIKMRIRSSVGTSAGDLQLLLDNTASVASPVHTLNIPSLTANTWTTIELAYTPTTGSDAIISIGLKYTVDIGAANVDLDDIWAMKTSTPAVSTNGLRLMEVRADANISQVERITANTVANSTLYTVSINGVDINYTSDASATAAEIYTNLAANINASTDPAVTPVTATDETTSLKLSADVAGVSYTVSTTANLTTVEVTPNSTGNVYEVTDLRDLSPTVRGTEGSGASAAADVSYEGSTNLVATDVEAALDELDTEKAAATDLTAHINDTSDAHDASAVSYTGSTNLSSTDVEAALDELDSEKAATGHTHSAGNLDSLSDVTIASPANNEVLTYDSSDSTWKNETWIGGGSGVGSIDGVSPATGGGDVDLVAGTGIAITPNDASDNITIAQAPIAYTPFAIPLGGHLMVTNGSTEALAANGGTMLVPVVVDGYMLLEQLTFWNADTSLARGPAEFALYVDAANNSNSISLVTGAVGTLASWTPSGGSSKTIPVTSPPITIPPGLYWLALKNNHASNSLGVGGQGTTTTYSPKGYQTKTLSTSAFGSTLDAVAVTWTKQNLVPNLRLQGRMFGQSSAW